VVKRAKRTFGAVAQRLPCRMFGRRGVGPRAATAHRQMASQTLRRVTRPQLRAGRVASFVHRMMPHDSKG
jgi:hypothetical protein